MIKDRVIKSDAEWKSILPPRVYRVTRRKGTEPVFSGKYHNFNGKRIYACAHCGNELFSFSAKYDSGIGWHGLYALISERSVRT